MPYIPHTENDVQSMLAAIGVDNIEALFDEIPAALRITELNNVPSGMSEMETARLLHERAAQDGRYSCFIGAGAYEHHIPAAVWELTTRGEFYTSYTPYQAEASQGTLQLLYEYQTMMAGLTGMEVSNASLYDGASALAEAVLMAVRANRHAKTKRVLMPRTVNPVYRKVVNTIVASQGIVVELLDYSREQGITFVPQLPAQPGDFAALIIPQPNFFGALEEVDALTDWAHQHNALVIGVVNPTALALLKPPGEWGTQGADIACGEGQPLGIPLASGGPYFGFLCAKQALVRQMPGRIVGCTVDLEGKRGFALTLQAREQHIRRSKATSNICTNQGLMVTAATIYLSLLGYGGLSQVALASHAGAMRLADKLGQLPGVVKTFTRPSFHEFVVRLERPIAPIMEAMQAQNILAGYDLGQAYPELNNHLLICVTETKNSDDLARYVEALRAA